MRGESVKFAVPGRPEAPLHRINTGGANLNPHSVSPCRASGASVQLPLQELPVPRRLRTLRFFALGLLALFSLFALVLGAWWCMQ